MSKKRSRISHTLLKISLIVLLLFSLCITLLGPTIILHTFGWVPKECNKGPIKYTQFDIRYITAERVLNPDEKGVQAEQWSDTTNDCDTTYNVKVFVPDEIFDYVMGIRFIKKDNKDYTTGFIPTKYSWRETPTNTYGYKVKRSGSVYSTNQYYDSTFVSSKTIDLLVKKDDQILIIKNVGIRYVNGFQE